MKPFVVMHPDFNSVQGPDRWWVVSFDGRGQWLGATRCAGKLEAKAEVARRRRVLRKRKPRKKAGEVRP